MDDMTNIKNNLISRIQSSTDLKFLRALQTIFDSTEQELFQLSSEQEIAIERGLKDIDQGRTVSHEEVKKKYGL